MESTRTEHTASRTRSRTPRTRPKFQERQFLTYRGSEWLKYNVGTGCWSIESAMWWWEREERSWRCADHTARPLLPSFPPPHRAASRHPNTTRTDLPAPSSSTLYTARFADASTAESTGPPVANPYYLVLCLLSAFPSAGAVNWLKLFNFCAKIFVFRRLAFYISTSWFLAQYLLAVRPGTINT
ncbi:hypothetical protein B0H16DRAFT_121536 [Mycena metata]|uniref:Uncharacterized protein n=1 Tax=Mycena metata TaxID=1033252 RepID=A0AAD7MWV9_9AGAR|nr:hypothetical protein B0H16DRAFT_121536 [Mycena metata]